MCIDKKVKVIDTNTAAINAKTVSGGFRSAVSDEFSDMPRLLL